jgi:hypothetical protein
MNNSSVAQVVAVSNSKSNQDFKARVKYEYVVMPLLVTFEMKNHTFQDGSTGVLPMVRIFFKQRDSSRADANYENYVLTAGNENRLRALCHLAGVKEYPADLLQHPEARDFFVNKIVAMLNQPWNKQGIIGKPMLQMLFPKGAAAFKRNPKGYPEVGTPCTSVLLSNRTYMVTQDQYDALTEFYKNGEAQIDILFYGKTVTFRRADKQIINKHDLPCKFEVTAVKPSLEVVHPFEN